MKKIISALLIAALALSMLVLASCTKETMGGHPVGKLEFTNNAVDYKFYYPDTWQTQMNNGMACLYVSANDPSNVSVTKFGLGSQFTSLDDYITAEQTGFKSQWNAVFGETDFGEATDIKLGGVDAKQFVYEVKIGEVNYKYMQVFALRQDSVYTLTYAARAELYDTHIANVNEIIESFAFKA